MHVFLRQNLYHFRALPQEVSTCRNIPGCRFDGASGCWVAPFSLETWASCQRLGIDVAKMPKPTTALYHITAHKGKYLVLKTPFSASNTAKCNAIPDSRAYKDDLKAWVLKPTLANLNYLERAFPVLTWDETALAMAAPVKARIVAAAEATVRKQELVQAGDVEVTDHKFYTTPFSHQRVCFSLAKDKPIFALFMEQGTGKTFVNLNVAAYKYLHHEIDACLVVCPNGAKSNWALDEIPTHFPPWISRSVFVWEAGFKKAEQAAFDAAVAAQGIVFLIMNVEAFAHPKAVVFAEKFLKSRSVFMTVDESSRIKTPSAKRTKALLKLGKLAKVRQVMTGTPVTQGPLDVYTQAKFLDESILGFSSFYGFRNYYALLGGYMGRDVVGYAHLDELQARLDPYSYRRLRSECLDLPDKLYKKHYVELSPEQRKIYDEMAEYMVVEFGDGKASAAIVLTQMTRLQQITGGFVPVEYVDEANPLEARTNLEQIPGTNPKIEALLEIAEETQGKIIVWARFRAEIDIIQKALREKYGQDSVVEYHGGVSNDDRTINRKRFQDPNDPSRFFVAQPATASMSLTLTQAKTEVYYSNTFSLEDRLQSEDRAMRIGQTENVLIIDLVAKNTLDPKVVVTLRSKKSLADAVTGDAFKDWI